MLLCDTITCLTEGNNHQIWIGTLSGINAIDQISEQVVFSGLPELRINTIKVFDNELWVGTERGLYVKKGQDHSFQFISVDQKNSVDPRVYSIISDTDGAILAGIGNKLFRSENKDGTRLWECILDPDQYGLEIDQIDNLELDNERNIWISCTNGLYKLNPSKKQAKLIIRSIDSSHSLAINHIKPLLLDKIGRIWYGTYGQGIYRINISNDQFTNFQNNPGDLQSISENSINCVFEDRSGNIWFGTFGAGINIYQPEAHKFGFMSHQPFDSNSLSSSFIWSIWECKNQSLLIGTNDAGLNIYDPSTDKYKFYLPKANDPYAISHSSVRKIYQDSKKRIWVGTDGGGLNRFFPEIGQFIHYLAITDDTTSISGNSVRVIYEDEAHRLWIGTRSGLNLFDPEKGTFKRFVHVESDPNSISNDFVYSVVHHDKKGNLWVGTYGGGLNKMNTSNGKFEHYLNDPSDPKSISDNIVFSIYEESSGILWIGTNSGLNRYDPETGNFQRFGTYDGLPNEVIYGILPDEKNNLWLSTNKGICRFNLDNYSTKNFTANDGLQSNEFNGGAFHKGQSGWLYFGGVYGLNIIDPVQTYTEENKSQVVFTSLAILGNEVNTKSDSVMPAENNQIIKLGGSYFMMKNIAYTDEIILDYQHRFFSIEYAALNSNNTDNLRFQYVMEGLDDNWNDVGTRTYITFANLQPGEYNLIVRSFNSDNLPGLSDAHVKIIVPPPFWKTWWFYFLEFLLMIVLLGFIYKYLLKIRTNRLLRSQNEKIFLANQKLLESENNLKNLNDTKDKFFSIISHDLKNPFTSLLSISELMADDFKSMDEDEKEKGIKQVHNSAKRIYNLLDNLLTWSRARTESMKFEPVSFELGKVVEENMLLHQEAAKQKNINLQKNELNSARAYGDPVMISTVLRNLLSNAIKFTPKGKLVRVETEDAGSKWKINVIDLGVGMSTENLDKIFQIETKIKTEGTSGEKGTGLGLLICQEFVQKNGGNIHVESIEGKGSTFSFTVPKSDSFSN